MGETTIRQAQVENQVAPPTGFKYTHLAPSDNRSTKSADGRVATEAAWLNGSNLEKEEINEPEREKKRKDDRKVLTLTGLLMEGVS